MQETREAQTRATQVLLYHTLLVSELEFLCGNCGNSVKPHVQIRCPNCRVRWIFSAATYESPSTIEEQAQTLKALLPSSFTFIGHMDATGVHEAYMPLSIY